MATAGEFLKLKAAVRVSGRAAAGRGGLCRRMEEGHLFGK